MAKTITEASYLRAIKVQATYEEQLQNTGTGIKAVVKLVGDPLQLVLEAKRTNPKHSKSWIVNRLLKELKEYREGKR